MGSKRDLYPIILAVLAILAFIPFLGRGHLFDWDEVNFAEISREMILLKDYLRIHVDFVPFWEKPPLFFWFQVLAIRIFGIGEYAARLPNAICGLFTILILYRMGKLLFDREFGLLWAGAYFGSIFPHMYFKTGLIDPWFNLFIFLGLYFFIQFYWKRTQREVAPFNLSKNQYLVLAGLAVGLGVLTKGQVAYLVVCLTIGVYWLIKRWRLPVSIPQFLLFTTVTAAVTLTWYGLETMKNGPWFVQEFTKYQFVLFSTPSAGHSGFPGYHFVVNLFGVFPASILALPALFRFKLPESHQQNFRLWMLVFFWVVIILFSIVRSKIIHYSSLVYFPLTFLAACTLYEAIRGRKQWPRWGTIALAIVGGFIAIAITIAPMAGMQIERLASQVQDPFARANMQANVSWSYGEMIIGVILLGSLITGSVMLSKHKYRHAALILFAGTALTINLALYHFVPKIEGYSQRAAVEFFENLQGEDCYVAVLGYKSYVQYYYSRKQPGQRPESRDQEWLLTGPIDKPVYFATKVDRADRYAVYEGMEVLYEKNGFVFLRRVP